MEDARASPWTTTVLSRQCLEIRAQVGKSQTLPIPSEKGQISSMMATQASSSDPLAKARRGKSRIAPLSAHAAQCIVVHRPVNSVVLL